MFITNLYVPFFFKKRLDFYLLQFYGIGLTNAKRIYAHLGYNRFYNFFIYEDNFNKILEIIIFKRLKLIISLDLRYIVLINFKNLIKSFCYRIQRQQMFLPSRGQRTRKNALTQKLKRLKGSFFNNDHITKRILQNLDRAGDISKTSNIYLNRINR